MTTDFMRFLEMFDAGAHPRADPGSAAGGEFVAASGGAAAKEPQKKPPPKGKEKPREKPKQKQPSGTLTYKTGYGKKGGDPRVRRLQAALNRLGLTDSNGKKLAVDGQLGPLTTSAIKKAQKQMGVEQTGVVTPAFLRKLTQRKPEKKVTHKKSGGAEPKGPPAGKLYDLNSKKTSETVRIESRVVEAKEDDERGNRVFHVRMIAYGDSRNGRRYPREVMESASSLYNGAKAYDHHRTDEELKTSATSGIIGYFQNVQAGDDGLYADLHLMSHATKAAEALDTTVELQSKGMPPLVGLSHDVMANFRPIHESGRTIQEAVGITSVQSVDLVATPAAGGQVERVVAGGVGTLPATDTEGGSVTATVEDVLGALKQATPEQLAEVGLQRVDAEETEPEAEEVEEPQPEVEETEEPDAEEPGDVAKESFLAKLMIKAKVQEAGLPDAAVDEISKALPARVREADVDDRIDVFKKGVETARKMWSASERGTGVPKAPYGDGVAKEALDKKKDALDAFFAGDFNKGYYSFKQAYMDYTGNYPRDFTRDFNKQVLRESFGPYDSGDRRAEESADTSTWNLVLGDSITRRMVAEYSQPGLDSWKTLVSSTVPVNDFRTQRIDRVGGYGTLPAVNQGATYNPLTTPGNEEVTYALTKRGGTEDITMEMIANDDVRAISAIPRKLGMAAAQTLFRFVWDFFNPASNPTIYDGAGLWTGHSNADTNALSMANVSVGRRKMRSQTAYGDAVNFLAIVPKYLVVVKDLEELAFQICTSTVALPSGAPVGAASDIPNLHKGLEPIVVDYFTSSTGWMMVGDPNRTPTFELGFYQGRQDPELFTQSDQTVGSMFDADKLTYKIRHIYSGNILDFRPFYRGNT